MKSFLKLLFVFLIPILLIGVSLEFLLRNIPNDYSQKSVYLNKSSSNIETLILGSSHSLYGINPKYLNGNTYNASFVSQTLDLDLAILKKYQNDFPHLKTVVIRLSYATLFEKLSDSNEDWRLKDYNLYLNLNMDYKLKHYSELLSVKLKTNLKRIYDYYILNISEITTNESGWGSNANFEPSKDLNQAGINVAKRHTISDRGLYKYNTEIFKAIAEFCEAKQIQLLVVTMPGYSSYVKHMNENQLRKTIEFGKSLDKNYDNCTYYNFLNDARFTESDFFDGDHLNEKGAKTFSLILNNELKLLK